MPKTVIGSPQGPATTLASLSEQKPAEERMSFVCEPPVGGDHSVAAMLQGLRDARAKHLATNYSMDDVNALFEAIFGHRIDDTIPLSVELPFIDASEDSEVTGDISITFTDPEIYEEMFGMTDEEYAAADVEAEEQLAFAKAYNALMRMLDVYAFVSGTPVTTEQRVAMTLLLSNDDTAEAFATAAEDLLNSGLFE